MSMHVFSMRRKRQATTRPFLAAAYQFNAEIQHTRSFFPPTSTMRKNGYTSIYSTLNCRPILQNSLGLSNIYIMRMVTFSYYRLQVAFFSIFCSLNSFKVVLLLLNFATLVLVLLFVSQQQMLNINYVSALLEKWWFIHFYRGESERISNVYLKCTCTFR